MTKVRTRYSLHEYICKCSTSTFILIYQILGNVENFNDLIMNTYINRHLCSKQGCVLAYVCFRVLMQHEILHTYALCDHFVPVL